MVPTGKQTRLANRVGWCRTHLKQAGLIEYVRSGVFRITQRGKEVLAKKPAAINLKFLDEIPEHRAWFHRPKSETEPSTPVAADSQTPEERMGALAEESKQKLAADVLDRLKAMSEKPDQFERVVLELLKAMGYGDFREDAVEAGNGSKDGGIDGLINEDRLGLERIYIQAKCWVNNPVGAPEIQKFVGALSGKKANKGVFITTSTFSSEVPKYLQFIDKRVALIDGQRLAELMVEHNLGVSKVISYDIKRIDSDYFEEVE